MPPPARLPRSSRRRPGSSRSRSRCPEPAAPDEPPHELNAPGDGECDPECEHESLPSLVLERAAAEVSEERPVERPTERRGDVVQREPPPRKLQRSGAERDRGAPTGNET